MNDLLRVDFEMLSFNLMVVLYVSKTRNSI